MIKHSLQYHVYIMLLQAHFSHQGQQQDTPHMHARTHTHLKQSILKCIHIHIEE